jgi:hypothetical protein
MMVSSKTSLVNIDESTLHKPDILPTIGNTVSGKLAKCRRITMNQAAHRGIMGI